VEFVARDVDRLDLPVGDLETLGTAVAVDLATDLETFPGVVEPINCAMT
jgi:hypothetical protein